jgi:hypothetical protein
LITDHVCPRDLAEIRGHESETTCEVLDSEVSPSLSGSALATALASEPEPEASSRSLEDILDDSWDRVMFGPLPQTTVEDWKSADFQLANFFRANPGQLPVNSNKGKASRQPAHLNFQDKKLMPTPSEIAFLRAARNSTEVEMDEWLDMMKDPEFKPREGIRFKRAKQAKHFMQKTSANFCNLGVKQHQFTSTDSKSCPFGALVDCLYYHCVISYDISKQ